MVQWKVNRYKINPRKTTLEQRISKVTLLLSILHSSCQTSPISGTALGKERTKDKAPVTRALSVWKHTSCCYVEGHCVQYSGKDCLVKSRRAQCNAPRGTRRTFHVASPTSPARYPILEQKVSKLEYFFERTIYSKYWRFDCKDRFCER